MGYKEHLKELRTGASNSKATRLRELFGKEDGTKPLSQTKEGLEFEFFLKFQSFYFA